MSRKNHHPVKAGTLCVSVSQTVPCRCCLRRAATHDLEADIDLFELSEAFASVVLRHRQAFDLDRDTLNVCGGAIAMGHPLGATAGAILGTVLDSWSGRAKSTALVTLCNGAGMGTAAVIERV